jgi:hypothetical protein
MQNSNHALNFREPTIENSLHVAPPTQKEHATFNPEIETIDATGMQPLSLQALAHKVLERNASSNNYATEGKSERNFLHENRFKQEYGFNDPFSVSYDELKIACGDDWQEVTNDPRLFSLMTDALKTQRMRERGITPPHYTKTVICKHCGTVKLWEGASNYVLGCPWCLQIATEYKRG